MSNHQEKRELLYSLLGPLPPKDRPVSAEILSLQDNGIYISETLLLDLNGREAVPAFFAYPRDGEGPWPFVLFNHAHGGDYTIGKEEFIRGRDVLQSPPYAEELTKAGYCALCIDAWNFGERRGRTESELFKLMLWQGEVLWGFMMYDSIKALDYALSRPEADPKRVATLGISMGSTMAWWLAALDTRVQVCVDICCLTDFASLIDQRGLDRHGIYYYVPGLLRHFDTISINSLICPRPHLSIAGNFDQLTPVEGLEKVDQALRALYTSQGVPERWQLQRYDTGHLETAAARKAVLDFLRRWL